MGIKKRKSLTLLPILALASCSLPYFPSDPLTFKSAKYNFENIADYRQAYIGQAFLSNENVECHRFEGSPIVVGFNTKTGKYGAMSVFKDEAIVPFEFDLLGDRSVEESVITTPVASYAVFEQGGKTAIFDEMGHLLTPPFDSSLEWKIEGGYHKYECSLASQAVETLEIEGCPAVVNKIENDGTRLPIEFDPLKLIKRSDGRYFEAASNAASIGLEDYAVRLSAEGIMTTSKYAQDVASFRIPSYDVGCFFHKSLFYQTAQKVKKTDAYDFEDGDDFYKVSTNRIELLNGHSFSMDFPYLLSSIRPIYDDEAVADYALIEFSRFKDGALSPQKEHALINYEGAIIRNIGDEDKIYLHDALGIDWNAFYSTDGYLFYDSDFSNPWKVEDLESISYVSRAIITRSKQNVWGARAFDGEVLFSNQAFETLDASAARDGKALAITSDGIAYSLDVQTGNKALIQLDDDEFVSENRGHGTALTYDAFNQGKAKRIITWSGSSMSISPTFKFVYSDEIHIASANATVYAFHPDYLSNPKVGLYTYCVIMK